MSTIIALLCTLCSASVLGVYLSMGGKIIPPNGTIFINDIGTSSQQLVCSSDRKPCCRDQLQYGEWKFPNGNQVIHITEGAVTFHRNRDSVGNVNLFRVSRNVMSPTGWFCCEIPDANDSNHTLCVNICEYKLNTSLSQTVMSFFFKALPVTAHISDEGIPTAGQRYSLTCSVSGAEGLNDTTITYQWTKNNGTQTQVETNSNTLSFSPLRLSDAGEYTCEIIVISNSLIKDATASFKHFVNVSSKQIQTSWPIN